MSLARAVSLLVLGLVAFLEVGALSTVPGLTSYFSERDLAHATSFTLAQQRTDGSFGDKLGTSAHAVKLLTFFNASVPHTDKLCALFTKVAGNEQSSASQLHHAVTGSKALQCGVNLPPNAVERLLKQLAAPSTSTSNIFYAAMTLLLTNSGKDKQVVAAAERLLALQDEDGLFRGSASVEVGSALNTGLAYSLLATLYAQLSDSVKQQLRAVVSEKLESVFATAEQAADFMVFMEHEGEPSYSDTNIMATAMLFFGASELAKATKAISAVTAQQSTALVQYLIASKQTRRIDALYFAVVVGLGGAGTSNPFGVPLAVIAERATIAADATDPNILVRVGDVFGRPAGKLELRLVSAQAVGGDERVLLKNQSAQSTDADGVYSVDFLAAKPAAGLYRLRFTVEPLDPTMAYVSVGSATIEVKLMTTATIQDFSVVVADDISLAKPKTYSSVPPEAVSERIHVRGGKHVRFSFSIVDVTSNAKLHVHQAFVRLQHKASGEDIYLVASYSALRGHTLSLDVNDALDSQLNGRAGAWNVTLIVGDRFLTTPILFAACTLELGSARAPRAAAAATVDADPFAPQPEIQHVFRITERRPPAVVSQIFTVLALAPLALLLLGLVRVGANLSMFPTAGVVFLYASGFLASLGAIFLLLVAFYTKFNMIETIQYLGVLCVPTTVFGIKSLQYLSLQYAIKKKKE